jgi:pyrroloquinoline quinone biosynthesis protein D
MRLQVDRITGEPILLGPELAVQLTDSGAEILKQCDGRRSLREISDGIAKDFDAPADEILADALAFLGRLAEKGYVRWSAP